MDSSDAYVHVHDHDRVSVYTKVPAANQVNVVVVVGVDVAVIMDVVVAGFVFLVGLRGSLARQSPCCVTPWLVLLWYERTTLSPLRGSGMRLSNLTQGSRLAHALTIILIWPA